MKKYLITTLATLAALSTSCAKVKQTKYINVPTKEAKSIFSTWTCSFDGLTDDLLALDLRSMKLNEAGTFSEILCGIDPAQPCFNLDINATIGSNTITLTDDGRVINYNIDNNEQLTVTDPSGNAGWGDLRCL